MISCEPRQGGGGSAFNNWSGENPPIRRRRDCSGTDEPSQGWACNVFKLKWTQLKTLCRAATSPHFRLSRITDDIADKRVCRNVMRRCTQRGSDFIACGIQEAVNRQPGCCAYGTSPGVRYLMKHACGSCGTPQTDPLLHSAAGQGRQSLG